MIKTVAPISYKAPPKRVYRAMGLGIESDGCIKVVAGFQFRWWVPDFLGPAEPLFVRARILRRHKERLAVTEGKR